MAFKAPKDLMGLIWDEMPKAPDEDHLMLTPEDIDYLWHHGFVDSDSFTLLQWQAAFEPHKRPDGSFLLTKNDFLEKEKYRYTGEILEPFDALLINEGKYTDEGLQELIDQSITPSCSKSAADIDAFFTAFKESYRGGDNLIKMNMGGKRQIARIIDENPSPARQRELLFDAMFRMQMGEIAEGAAEIARATPDQAAKIQVSTFTTVPSAGQKAAKELKSIQKSRKPAASGDGDEGIEVKKVRKSRKGFRG